MSLIRSVTLSGALLLLAAPAAAQTPVSGRVLEFTADQPVAAAQVELLDARERRVASTTTDESGAFRFASVRPGSYSIRARSIGYREVATPAFTVADEPVSLIVRIAVDAVPLAPLEVVTRPAPLHANLAISDFMERSRRRMGGTFMMIEEIEERQPRHVSDLLRTVGSFTVFDSGGRSMGGTIFNNRSQCQPTVWIDGQRVFSQNRGRPGGSAFEWVNSVHWSELQGIEIYAGAATIPAQFSGSEARCGVIALWTRR